MKVSKKPNLFAAIQYRSSIIVVNFHIKLRHTRTFLGDLSRRQLILETNQNFFLQVVRKCINKVSQRLLACEINTGKYNESLQSRSIFIIVGEVYYF
jgi:hypothetical protein